MTEKQGIKREERIILEKIRLGELDALWARQRTLEHFCVEDGKGGNRGRLFYCIYYTDYPQTAVGLSLKNYISESTLYRYRREYVRIFWEYYRLKGEKWEEIENFKKFLKNF
ncbi:MAG: hypothetical protein IJY62_06045 [Clostridia bacterium]|nr:hypothetical protein [Clostridia bacterium]